jgi:hypothetical protein
LRCAVGTRRAACRTPFASGARHRATIGR